MSDPGSRGLVPDVGWGEIPGESRKLHHDPVRIGEIHRTNEHPVMVLARYAKLAVVMVDHRMGMGNPRSLQFLQSCLEIALGHVESQMVHGTVGRGDRR